MIRLVALLRAVDVGGTGRLAMAELQAICRRAGFSNVETYIASGNVVFDSRHPPPEAKAALEAGLQAHLGARVGVLIRSGVEIAEVLARNPFPDAPGNRVTAIFLDRSPSAADLNLATGRADDEVLALGTREIYVRYGSGMARSRLVLSSARSGTARNMNTVAKLAAMAADG